MILLAGGSGHLGRVLAGSIRSRGTALRVLTRHPDTVRNLLGDGVELVLGDVRVASTLRPALAGVDTVISAVTGFGPRGEGPRKVDVEGNHNLVEEATAAGAKRFVLVSIHGAGPAHPEELYRAKYEAEELVRRSQLEWTIVRPTIFMELWAGIIGDSLVKSGVATVLGRGNNPVNLVSVRDVASVIELAVFDGRFVGEVVDVGGPENLTLNQVAATLASAGGRRTRARHVPLAALRAGALAMRPFRSDLARLIGAAVRMDTADMTFDADALCSRYPDLCLTSLADIAAAAGSPG